MTSVQETFEGMPRRLLQAAPSRLTTYLDCPRRYRFNYLDRPPPAKGPPWAHNSFGATVHAVLANWWRLPVAQRTIAAARQLLDEGWLVDGYRDAAQSLDARRIAWAMLERYVDRLDPYAEPVGIERTVAVKTDHAALYGRVDRIDTDAVSGELVIVDYKTGRHVLALEDARTSMALAIYAAAAERTLRRRCRRVELHHLPTGEVIAWTHSDETLARQIGRADSLADEIARLDERFRGGVGREEADAMYPVRPGPICAWCDFNRACREGSAAAEPRLPWAGIAVS